MSGSTPSSSDYFTLSFNLKDPCDSASINIDPQIINPTILFVINDPSSQDTYTLDPTLVSLSTDAICPAIELNIVNANGQQLPPNIMNFDAATKTLNIVAMDSAFDVGDYPAKIIARFASFASKTYN